MLILPFLEAPGSPFYYESDDEWGMMRLRSTACIEASYEHYLRTGVLSFYIPFEVGSLRNTVYIGLIYILVKHPGNFVP